MRFEIPELETATRLDPDPFDLDSKGTCCIGPIAPVWCPYSVALDQVGISGCSGAWKTLQLLV